MEPTMCGHISVQIDVHTYKIEVAEGKILTATWHYQHLLLNPLESGEPVYIFTKVQGEYTFVPATYCVMQDDVNSEESESTNVPSVEQKSRWEVVFSLLKELVPLIIKILSAL